MTLPASPLQHLPHILPLLLPLPFILFILFILSFLTAPTQAQLIGDPGPGQLNVLFLVEVVAIYVVVIGIFFFINRLLGIVVGFFLRLWGWKSQRVWIKFGSLQISLLGGRILFKDFQYHSSNMSIRVMKGHLSWRYWIWKVKGEEDESGSFPKVTGQSDTSKPKRDRPSRGVIYVEGFEWFLYNRTPAFDAIVERMKQQDASEHSHAHSHSHSGKGGTEDNGSESRQRNGWQNEDQDGNEDSSDRNQTPQSSQASRSESSGQPPSDPPLAYAAPIRPAGLNPHPKNGSLAVWQWQRDFFPLDILVNKGAVVLGNDATPSVVIAEFKRAKGCQETAEARSKFDLYRLLTTVKFSGITVLLRTNPDYVGPILDLGKRADEKLTRLDPQLEKEPREKRATRRNFHKLAHIYKLLSVPLMPKHPYLYYDSSEQWKGLPRYQKDTWGTALPTLQATDYAKVTKILEAPDIDLVYYQDVAGLVPQVNGHNPASDPASRLAGFDIGNGDLSPEWGIDLVVHNGRMTYGPWADRQRDAFTKSFLPSVFFHSAPTQRLVPGQDRKHTELKVSVELQGTTVMRMPTREASKDWDHRSDKPDSPVRKYGWIDIHIGPNSSFKYVSPVVANVSGYDTMLELHLDDIAVSSSVNYRDFLKAKSCRVLAQMPTPLQWDAMRNWTFDIGMDRPDILLLRDHTTLLSDLAKDWSSGPTGDFLHFLPYDYQFKIQLTNPKLGLYLNDFNIVDDPADLERNCILFLQGPEVLAEVEIPLIRYRPESTTIPFSIKGTDLNLSMHLPNWHTHHSFATERTRDFGKVGSLGLRGSYLYYSSAHPDHTETLTLFFELSQVRFRLLGWVVRRLMLLKENYFGTFTNFMLSSEFLQRFQNNPKLLGDPVEKKYVPGKSDRFECNVDLQIMDGIMILPTEIYDCKRAVILPIPALDLHLRSTEAYMELSLNVDPTGFYMNADSTRQFEDRVSHNPTLPLIALDGLSITANRLFGLPPRALTYLCLWEVVVGDLSGNITMDFVKDLSAMGRVFAFNFVDGDNAPLRIYTPAVDPDATFTRINISSLTLSIWEDPLVVNVNLPNGLQLNTNSLASQQFASSIHIRCTDMSVRVLIERHFRARRTFRNIASIASDLYLDTFSSPSNARDIAKQQQEFMAEQDSLTHRLAPLLRSLRHNHYHSGPLFLPYPLDDDTRVMNAQDGGASLTDSQSDQSSARSMLYDGEQANSADDDASDVSYPILPTPSSRRQPSGWNTSDDSSSDTDEDDNTSSTSSQESLETIVDPGNGADEPKLFQSFLHDHLLNDLQQCEYDDDLKAFNIKPVASTRAPATSEEHSSAPIPPVNLVGEPIDHVVTKLRMHKELSIIITPPGVAALMDLHTSYAKPSTNPHRMLDGWLIEQVRSSQKSVPTVAESTVMDVAIRRVTVSLLQHVGEYGRGCNRIEISADNADVRSTTVSRDAVDPFTPSQSKSIDRSMRFGVGRLKVFEPIPVDPGVNQVAPNSQYLVELVDAETIVNTGSSEPTSVSATLERAQIGVTPKNLLSLKSSSEHWQTLAKSVSRQHPRSVQTRIQNQVLASAVHEQNASQTPIDIGFMTENNLLFHSPYQPEFDEFDEEPVSAVQGRRQLLHPQQSVRENPGWKVLAYLRQRLWDVKELPELLANAKRGDGDEIGQDANQSGPGDWLDVSEALRRWRGWDIGDGLEDLSFLKSLPGHPAAKNAPHARSGVIFACAVKNLEIYVFDASLAILAEVQVTTFDISLESSPEQSQPLRCVLGVGKIEVGARMALIDIVNQLPQDIFPSTKRKPTAVSSDPPTKRPIPCIVLDVRDSVLTIMADGLRVGLRTRLLTALCSSTSEDNGLTLTLSTEEIDATVNIREEQKELELMSVTLSGINSLFKLTEPRSREMKLAVNIDQCFIGSNVEPRTSWKLVHRWQEANHIRYLNMFKRARDRFGKLRGTSQSVSSPPANRTKGVGNVVINRTTLQLAISNKVSFFWDIHRSMIMSTWSASDAEKLTMGHRLQLGAQEIGFSETAQLETARDHDSNVLVKLPVIRATANITMSPSTVDVKSHVMIDRFLGTFKPNVLDRALSVYKAVHRDIRSLSVLFVTIFDQLKKDLPKRKQVIGPNASRTIQYDLQVETQGVYIMLKASKLACCLCVEADSFGARFRGGSVAHATDADLWRLSMKRLKTSLAQDKTSTVSGGTAIEQTAYVVMSLDLTRRPAKPEDHVEGGKLSLINVKTDDVHSVMQVTALAQIYDFMNSWSADLAILRHQRIEEWTDIVQNTSKLIQTETKAIHAQQDREGWMNSYVIIVEIAHIAVALPLETGALSSVPRLRSKDIGATFLFTIALIEANMKKGESMKAEMQDLMMQFVDVFAIDLPESYRGFTHPTENRVHLPKVEAQAHREVGEHELVTQLTSTFKGFELRLNHRILKYVQQFSNVFYHGHEQIAQFAKEYPIDMANLMGGVDSEPLSKAPRKASTLRCSFDFLSGAVVLVSKKQYDAVVYQAGLHIGARAPTTVSGEIIVLPGVGLWFDAIDRITSTSSFASDEPLRQDFLINIVVNPSKNTVKPTILDFFSQLEGHEIHPHRKQAPCSLPPKGIDADRKDDSMLTSLSRWTDSRRVSLVLTIKKSELTLTCEPDTKTVLVLDWESGGVSVQILPSAKSINATLIMDSLSAKLGHKFSLEEEHSVADIEFLRGSILWKQNDGGVYHRTMEIVIDTMFRADAQLSRLQEILCVQAVWISRIPILVSEPVSAPETTTMAEDQVTRGESSCSEFVAAKRSQVVLFVHVQELNIAFVVFDAESLVTLSIKPLKTKARYDGETMKLTMDFHRFSINGHVGAITGDVHNDCIAMTINRQLSNTASIATGTLLNLQIVARDLVVSLEHDDQTVFRLHLLPSKVNLHDDWSDFDLADVTKERVTLSFDVHLGDLNTAFAILSIPDSLHDMEEIARRWTQQIDEAIENSEAFRETRESKPTNAFTSISLAMQQSASDRRLTEAHGSVRIAQELALHLDRTTFGLYKNSVLDNVVFMLDVYDFKTSLTRESKQDGLERNFNGCLDGVHFRRYDRRGEYNQMPKDVTVRDWLMEAAKGHAIELVRLPETNVTMTSFEEYVMPPVLKYSYVVRWGSVGNVDVDFQLGVYNEIRYLWTELQRNLHSFVELTHLSSAETAEHNQAESCISKIQYEAISLDIPTPQVGILRDKAAELLKPYENKWKTMAPRLTHEFVAKLLESGMDSLLSIYERSLPTRRGH